MKAEENTTVEGRRPLKVRDVGLAKQIAIWLTKKNMTPNQISLLSVVFAALAALCLLLASELFQVTRSPQLKYFLPVMAAVFIQCRLLCNLFDGMVAVEGGKSTPAGEMFNDIPDRIADPLILIAAGYVAPFAWSETLGWCAGLLAVMTAYIRTLAVSIGAPVNFEGPMAKQHRMAIMTGACLLAATEYYFLQSYFSFSIALGIIIFGCIITIAKRSYRAFHYLESKPQQENT